MKLSKYAALATRQSYCAVYRIANDGVWMGLRCALYRADGMPEIYGREQMRAILSLDSKQMDKIFLQEFDFEDTQNVSGFNLRHYDESEQTTKPVTVKAVVKGNYVSALLANDGELVFYDENYLQPLADVLKDSDYVEMTVRRLENGQRYIVVKDGFDILAIIMPMKVVNEEFLADLQEFETLCTEQLFRERIRAEAKAAAEAEKEEPEETGEQISLEE